MLIAHGALTTADLVASAQDGDAYSMQSTKDVGTGRNAKARISPIRRNFRWFAVLQVSMPHSIDGLGSLHITHLVPSKPQYLESIKGRYLGGHPP